MALLAAATAFLSFVDGTALTDVTGGSCATGGCGECEGDCDSDADCSGDLRCHFRPDGSTAIPTHPCTNTAVADNAAATCTAGGTAGKSFQKPRT